MNLESLGSFVLIVFLITIPIIFTIAIYKVIKSKDKNWKIMLIISGISFISLLVLATLFVYKTYFYDEDNAQIVDMSIPDDRIIVSNDSLCQIQIPESWKIVTGLNKNATLQVGNPKIKEYLIILNMAKQDLDGGLLGYEELITTQLSEPLRNIALGDIQFLEINGYKVVQRKVTGTFKYLNVDYLLTAIEGNSVFYQLLAWSVHSNYSKSLIYFNEVIGSFRELNEFRKLDVGPVEVNKINT